MEEDSGRFQASVFPSVKTNGIMRGRPRPDGTQWEVRCPELWHCCPNVHRRPQLWQSLLSGPLGRSNQATGEPSAKLRRAFCVRHTPLPSQAIALQRAARQVNLGAPASAAKQKKYVSVKKSKRRGMQRTCRGSLRHPVIGCGFGNQDKAADESKKK